MCYLHGPFAAQLGAGRTNHLIQLVASPEKFNGKLVLVRGFLLIAGRPHDVVGYILYLHKEDAENNLGNSVVIVPSEQMKRDQEKIDRMSSNSLERFGLSVSSEPPIRTFPA
jgi:hypothetical protein